MLKQLVDTGRKGEERFTKSVYRVEGEGNKERGSLQTGWRDKLKELLMRSGLREREEMKILIKAGKM